VPLHVPSTQLTEEMPFGPLRIAFDDSVLRPRPWTRAQSEWAADLLPVLPEGDVLELCAGVGHIGLLAVAGGAGTGRRLVQVDLDPAACAYAVRNAQAAGLPDVEVRCGPMQEVLAADERFPLVVADPPWVPSDRTGLHPEDPLLAIDGGPDGLDVVRTCLAVVGGHLTEGGAAVLQVGDLGQVDAVEAHLAGAPGLRLRVAERRGYERGALALLTRPTEG
jgi:methylase of polypeptide subunit release factors